MGKVAVAVALATLALTGCYATFPLDGGIAHVDQRLHPAVRRAITRSVARWCKQTRGRVCPQLVAGSGKFAFVLEGRRPGAAATTHQRWTSVRIGLDLGKLHATLWEAAITHEIGHALDLEHEPTGLMRGKEHGGPWKRPKGIPRACIDRAALRAFCKRHGCPNGVEVDPECASEP